MSKHTEMLQEKMVKASHSAADLVMCLKEAHSKSIGTNDILSIMLLDMIRDAQAINMRIGDINSFIQPK